VSVEKAEKSGDWGRATNGLKIKAPDGENNKQPMWNRPMPIKGGGKPDRGSITCLAIRTLWEDKTTRKSKKKRS